MKTFIVLSAVLAVALAIPLKPDDAPKLKQEAEEDSSKNVEEFVTAFKSNDKQTVAKLTEPMVKESQEGLEYAKKLVPKLVDLQDKLNNVAQKGRSWLMKGAAFMIDGNRDNKAYYALQKFILFVNKRQEKGVVDPEFGAAGKACKEAQDHLQEMAGTFVEGIKSMRQDLSNMKDINAKTSKTMAEHKEPFLAKYQECSEKLGAFLAKQK